MKLKTAMIEAYGTQIIEEYDLIMDKINFVLAAHLYAGDQGDIPACQLNRFFNDHLKQRK